MPTCFGGYPLFSTILTRKLWKMWEKSKVINRNFGIIEEIVKYLVIFIDNGRIFYGYFWNLGNTT